jgi:hypothetical protein
MTVLDGLSKKALISSRGFKSILSFSRRSPTGFPPKRLKG